MWSHWHVKGKRRNKVTGLEANEKDANTFSQCPLAHQDRQELAVFLCCQDMRLVQWVYR